MAKFVHPAVLAPEPISCQSITVTAAGVPLTFIARMWAPGDALRCHRCPRNLCNVDENGMCSLIVRGERVDRDSAVHFVHPALREPAPVPNRARLSVFDRGQN